MRNFMLIGSTCGCQTKISTETPHKGPETVKKPLKQSPLSLTPPWYCPAILNVLYIFVLPMQLVFHWVLSHMHPWNGVIKWQTSLSLAVECSPVIWVCWLQDHLHMRMVGKFCIHFLPIPSIAQYSLVHSGTSEGRQCQCHRSNNEFQVRILLLWSLVD